MKKRTFTFIGLGFATIELVIFFYFLHLSLFYFDENETLSNFYQFWFLNMVVIMIISIKIYDII